MKRKVQVWIDPESRNRLKSKAAIMGISLSEYMDHISQDDSKIIIPNKQKRRGSTWYGL